MRSSLFGLLFLSLVCSFARADGGLEGAMAIRDITPVVGVPLGGYGGGARRLAKPAFGKYPYATFFTPSVGVLDPIHAKAFLLQKGGERLLFVGIDAVGVNTGMRKELLKRIAHLGFREDQVFISATHTHSGPGALAQDLIFQLIAMDLFKSKIYQTFIDGIVQTIEDVVPRLEPVSLFSMPYTVTGLQANRRHKPGHFDPQAHAIFMRSDAGDWLGGIVNLPIHGTALSEENLSFSADVPGGIERAVTKALIARNQELFGESGRQDVHTLFINGAEGDVSPALKELDGIETTGRLFAEQTLSALPQARPVAGDWKVVSEDVQLGSSLVNLPGCVPKSGPSFPAEKNREEFEHEGFRPENIGDAKATVSAIRLGDIRIVTWPGEPTTTNGLISKAQALHGDGIRDGIVFGLTNDHLAYFTTAEEYHEGGYESCMTFYGPGSADLILAAQARLLGRL